MSQFLHRRLITVVHSQNIQQKLRTCHYVIMQVTEGALISVWKCTKSFWWPGSAWTRCSSLQCSPRHL